MKKSFLLLLLFHFTSILFGQIDAIQSIDSLFDQWNTSDTDTPGVPLELFTTAKSSTQRATE